MDTLKSIKNKNVVEGVKKRQAEAMTLQDLTKIIQWSEAQCPPQQLVVRQATSYPKDGDHQLNLSHGLMHAFVSSGFTLWTR